MVCGNITKKAITNNIARAINAVIQVLIFSILRQIKKSKSECSHF